MEDNNILDEVLELDKPSSELSQKKKFLVALIFFILGAVLILFLFFSFFPKG